MPCYTCAIYRTPLYIRSVLKVYKKRFSWRRFAQKFFGEKKLCAELGTPMIKPWLVGSSSRLNAEFRNIDWNPCLYVRGGQSNKLATLSNLTEIKMVITTNETVKNVSSIFLHIYAFTHLKVLKQERPTQTISSQLNTSKTETTSSSSHCIWSEAAILDFWRETLLYRC